MNMTQLFTNKAPPSSRVVSGPPAQPTIISVPASKSIAKESQASSEVDLAVISDCQVSIRQQLSLNPKPACGAFF
jgi:hypothetical protein